MTWVQTASGRAFGLLAPSAADVSAADIAEHLAKQPRFAGATAGVHYSVAQHSVVVGDALPPALRIHGYLHDAHEAYPGDDTSPKLAALAVLCPAAGEAMLRLRREADRAIREAFGVPARLEPAAADLLRTMDLRALATEKRDLMAPAPRARIHLPPPFAERIKPWPWPKAAETLLQRLRQHAPRVP